MVMYAYNPRAWKAEAGGQQSVYLQVSDKLLAVSLLSVVLLSGFVAHREAI